MQKNNDACFVKGLCLDDGRGQNECGWDGLEKCSAKEDVGFTGRCEENGPVISIRACLLELRYVLSSTLVFWFVKGRCRRGVALA